MKIIPKNPLRVFGAISRYPFTGGAEALTGRRTGFLETGGYEAENKIEMRMRQAAP